MHENDFEELLNHLNRENLDRYAGTHLSQKKQQQLHNILNNPDKLNEVLNSEEAKKVMKRLKELQNGKHS